MRVITSFGSTQCSNFNLKENIFVAISWIPKATVQVSAKVYLYCYYNNHQVTSPILLALKVHKTVVIKNPENKVRPELAGQYILMGHHDASI